MGCKWGINGEVMKESWVGCWKKIGKKMVRVFGEQGNAGKYKRKLGENEKFIR